MSWKIEHCDIYLFVSFNFVYNLGPEPVRDVNIINKTRGLQVSWKEPSNPFGIVRDYKVIHYVTNNAYLSISFKLVFQAELTVK